MYLIYIRFHSHMIYYICMDIVFINRFNPRVISIPTYVVISYMKYYYVGNLCIKITTYVGIKKLSKYIILFLFRLGPKWFPFKTRWNISTYVGLNSSNQMDEFSTTYVVNQYAMNPINMLYHRFLPVETVLHRRANWYDGDQKIRKPICIRLC